jgi:dienelactone hydrolase
VKTSFVSLPVAFENRQWQIAGELREPFDAEPRHAVVIVHGSAGVDSRGEITSRALNRTGIATLEIDLWAPRNVTTPLERPKSVADTLPDAFAALAFLAARPGIAPGRIGVTGFSWGGVVSMLTATRRYADALAPPGLRFAAHAPLYPVCWLYNTVPGYEFAELTGAPVFIQAGAADRYDAPERGLTLKRDGARGGRPLVAVTIYPGATHAWDRREPDIVANDPLSHEGKGGPVPFVYDPAIAKRSLDATVAFFSETLG